jgi:DUF1009 family protein
LAFEGETDPTWVQPFDHEWVKLGAVGETIKLLHRADVCEVVLIGAIKRPSFSQLKLDFRGMQLLAKVGLHAARGDDVLLSTIVSELETEGFGVLGADDIIQSMLASAGVMTQVSPDEQARLDIAVGIEVATCLGALDVGQAVVVQQGVVLGVEAIEGTDALLKRASELRRAGPGGVLVKLKKPRQDRRTDLPTVGAQTIVGAVEAGLQGIAIHAGHCLMVERLAMIERADEAGLFIAGISGSE